MTSQELRTHAQIAKEAQALSLDELIKKVTAFKDYQDFLANPYTPTIRWEPLIECETREDVFLQLCKRRLANILESMGHSVYRGMMYNKKSCHAVNRLSP